MTEVPGCRAEGAPSLDVCAVCQFVWFDTGEYTTLPNAPEKTEEEVLSPEARQKIALVEIEAIREKASAGEWGGESPEKWWQWIPGFFGMPVEQGAVAVSSRPWVTWGLAAFIAAISLLAFADLRATVDQFGLVPVKFWRYGGFTFVSSFVLHGGLFHLVSNLYFLLVFGDNVEDWLGKWRFILLLFLAAVVGDVMHILGDPLSAVPCVGASGGISGVVAFYALKFPRARLGFLVRFAVFFRWISMPAYALFLVWIAIQSLGVWAQLAGFSDVSSLAHIGGASVGAIFWFLTRKE